VKRGKGREANVCATRSVGKTNQCLPYGKQQIRNQTELGMPSLDRIEQSLRLGQNLE
jgi:hypothetical protein